MLASMRRFYEQLLGRWAIHGPDYNPFHNANDGKARGVSRILLHASWAGFAAAICAALTLIGPRIVHDLPYAPVVAALAILLAIKISHVLDGTYRADPLDWLCDVGAWGTAGALLAARLLIGAPAHPPAIIWPALLILYLLTYPWATP